MGYLIKFIWRLFVVQIFLKFKNEKFEYKSKEFLKHAKIKKKRSKIVKNYRISFENIEVGNHYSLLNMESVGIFWTSAKSEWKRMKTIDA